jgi:hypothetical protein
MPWPAAEISIGGIYFFFVFRVDDFLRGTLPPARRASERPMAIACLRLVTFFPDRPLFSFPLLRSCIAFFTFCFAFGPYFAMFAPPDIKLCHFPARERYHFKCNSITRRRKNFSFGSHFQLIRFCFADK